MNPYPCFNLPSYSSSLATTKSKPNPLYWLYLDDLATKWEYARTSIFSFEDAVVLHQELVADYREGVKGIGSPSNLDLLDDPSTHALLVRILVRLYRLGIAPQLEAQRLCRQLLSEMTNGLAPALKKVEELERAVAVAKNQVGLWKAKREEPWAWVSPSEEEAKAEAWWKAEMGRKEAELKEWSWVRRLEKEKREVESDA